MRRQLGIIGLLIGLGFTLVFGLIPVAGISEKTSANIDIYEMIFIFSWVFWLIFSAIEKIPMALNKKNAFVNYAAIMMFLSFFIFVRLIPASNSGAEFHWLHHFFGLTIYFGWTTIDATDLMMTRLLKRW